MQLDLVEPGECACARGRILFVGAAAGGAAWCTACPQGRAGLRRMRVEWDAWWAAMLAGFDRAEAAE